MALTARLWNVSRVDRAGWIAGAPNIVPAVTVGADRRPGLTRGQGFAVLGRQVDRVLVDRQIVGPHLIQVGVARRTHLWHLEPVGQTAKVTLMGCLHFAGCRVSPMTVAAAHVLKVMDALLEAHTILGVAGPTHLLGGHRNGRQGP